MTVFISISVSTSPVGSVSQWCTVALKMTAKDFPGNPVVKTPLAEAGDVGSIPDSVRPHILQATKSMCYNH